ncbi:MAG: Pr6Pr family membrane protein [Bacteroidetes bacterium]|nr:Pr6Pr family membrane protein [Bacteroidota bacterium]
MIKQKKYFLLLISIITWIGLIAQFGLMLSHRELSLAESIIRFFSYFTILTNLLVAITSTILLMNKKSAAFNFFSAPSILTAITVYIVIVGIIFNILLRPILNMQFAATLVSDILHVITPALFLIFWLMFVPKNGLQMKSVFGWLIYPVLYMIYTLIHGALTHFYPYPFIDINRLGYE